MESLSVNIYNSEYKLRGDNPEKIKEAAAIVDQQMKFVASKVPMQPTTTTAVLAALNTAEQFLAEQSRSGKLISDVVERLNQLDQSLHELIDIA
ncbi:MAG: cell division protein ZapA [Chlorobi bacterium]|nr:cell division protein ZapA [Chlorobiota bacterium]